MTSYFHFLHHRCRQWRIASRRRAWFVSPLAWFTLAAAVCYSNVPAWADYEIRFSSGTTQTVYQGAIGTLVISASNTGDTAIDIASLALGLQVIAAGANTGDVSITGVEAPSGSIWLNGITGGPDAASLLNGPLNGTSGYFSMTVSGEPDGEGNFGIIPVGGSVDLATISFTADNTAFGTWQFFVVNEEDEFGSTLTNLVTGGFNTLQFANATAPSYSATPNTGVSYQVGTVIIVPEPAALAICGSGLLAAVFFCRRRRR